jgi:hypothetical protein
MAKEACGGRDFTVVTMGIHSGKWKNEKNRKRRGGEGQRQAAPQRGGMKKKEGEKKRRKTKMSWV